MGIWLNRKASEARISEDVAMSVIARAGYKCEGCAFGRAAVKYHRRGTVDYDWSPANWLHLCLECVGMAEASPTLAELLRWVLRPGQRPGETEVMWRNVPSRLTDAGEVEQRRASERDAWCAL